MTIHGLAILQFTNENPHDFHFIHINSVLADLLKIEFNEIEHLSYALIKGKFPLLDGFVNEILNNEGIENLVVSIGHNPNFYQATSSFIAENTLHILVKEKPVSILPDQEKLYRMMAENSNDVIWLMNTKLETTYMSPAVFKQLGYSVEEYLSMPLNQRLPQHSYELVVSTFRSEYEKALSDPGLNSFSLQITHKHKDGRLVWGEMNLNFIRNSNNEIIELLGVTRNIDDRKKIEEQLLIEKERYRAIVDAYDGLLYICSSDFTIEYMNQKLIERTGYDGTGMKCFQVLHNLDDVCEWCVNDRIMKGEAVKWDVQSPKDNRWYKISNTPIFKPDGTISKQAMIEDISDAKLAEIALKESETQFRILAEASPMAVFIYQGEKFKYLNPAIEKLTKFSAEELFKMNFYELVHPDFSELVRTRGMQRQTGADLPSRYEFIILDKFQEEVWIDFNGTYIEFEGQSAALGTAYDITERKRAEAALISSEEKYRMLVSNQSEIILKIDADGILEYVSPSYCQIFGMKEADIIGKAFQPKIHEDDIHHSLDEMQKLKTEPFSCYIEQRLKTTEGWKWFAWSDKAIPDKKGKVQSIICVGRDITVRKQAEIELAKSEERFRSLIELAVDGIVIGDNDGNITHVSVKFLEIIQKEIHDVIGKHVSHFFDKEELDKEPLRFDLLSQNQTVFRERKMIRNDGKSIFVEMHSKRMPDGTYQAFFRDITERKQANILLNEQNRFLGTLINNLPGIVYRCKNDPDWTMEFISGRCFELTGFQPEDFVMNKKLSFNSIIREDFKAQVWEKWQFNLSKKTTFTDEYVIVAADGTEKWVFEQGAGVYNENKQLVALEGFIMDITDRKSAEDSLVKSQFNFKMLAGYNQLLSRAALVFAMAEDIEELEMMVLSYYQKLTGSALTMLMEYQQQKKEFQMKQFITGEDIRLMIFNIFGEGAFQQNIKINDAIEKDLTGQGVIKTDKIEVVSFGSFDTELLTELEKQANIKEIVVSTIQRQNKLIGTITAFIHEQSNVPDEILKTFSQIAGFALSRKKSEMDMIDAKERAEASDKMKSVFLGNISHEVKTPMNAILGFTELLEKPQIEIQERLKYTQIITKAGNQLLAIIDDLIDLAKIETGQMKIIHSKFDVIQLLKGLYDMLIIKFESKGLALKMEISGFSTEFQIKTDPLRLKQILINLLDNAYKYTISGEIVFGFTVVERVIRFYVKDTGIGISPEDATRIFERFVKLEDGHTGLFSGKGLGLSISKSLAEMLGGQIHLESAIHKGSVFFLTIPLQYD
jgi:PAS domain S-box-containing protein